MADEVTIKDQDIQELNGNSPYGLLSQAIAQNADIDTLERIMALQERWEKAQAIKAFYRALGAFQSEVPEIPQTKRVKFKASGNVVEYTYAPLPKIKEIIQPCLDKHGLSYRWEFENMEDGKIKGTCILTHEAGHSESSFLVADRDTSGSKNSIQSIGSARTYLQRYTIIAVLGLTSVEEDNDGAFAPEEEKKESEIPEPKEKVNWGKLITNCETLKELNAVWNRMNKLEQKEHKEAFTRVKGFIEDDQRKSKE
jgi:hypothetical protein